MPNITKILARGWKLEVNSGTVAVPTWVQIKGLKSFKFSQSKTDTDITDFDSGGYTELFISGRGFEVSAEGFYLVDKVDGTRDAGQDLCEDYALLLGEDAVKQFRITSPAAQTKVFKAAVGIGDIGGGNNDPTSWSVSLTVQGGMTTSP